MTFAIRNVLRPVSILLCIVLSGTQITQAAPIVAAAIPAESQAISTAAAPVPPEVRTAKKVFVENDGASIDMYNRFVAALKAWGYYTLVDSPENTDVIFGFQGAPLKVTIKQPSSAITLWTVSDPLNGLYPGGSKRRASLEIENLVSALKEVVGVPLTTEETAALKPATFRHTGAVVVLISILGGVAAAAVITLALHSRAKEKSMLLPVEAKPVYLAIRLSPLSGIDSLAQESKNIG